MVKKKETKQIRRILLIAIVSCLATTSLLGQATSTPQLAPGGAPPVFMLYRFFFDYQLHLDRKADELKKAGRNGEDFRTHFPRKIGLSNKGYATLRDSALSLEAKLAAKDAEATKVIIATRQANIDRVKLGFGGPPPVPEILKQMEKERQSIIEEEVKNLRSQLSPEEADRLDKFVTKEFSKSVTSETILPPHVSHSELLNRGGR